MPDFRTLRALMINPAECQILTVDGTRWLTDRCVLTRTPLVAEAFADLDDGPYELRVTKPPKPRWQQIRSPDWFAPLISHAAGIPDWRSLRVDPELFLYAPEGRTHSITFMAADRSGLANISLTAWRAWSRHLLPMSMW